MSPPKDLTNSFGITNIILKSKFTTEDNLKVLGNGSSNRIDMDLSKANTVRATTQENLRNLLEIAQSDFVCAFFGRMFSNK